jgi:hypothetical protein
MKLLSSLIISLALVLIAPAISGTAHARKNSKSATKSAKKSRTKARRTKRVRRKMRVKRRRGYRGHGVHKEDLRTEPLPKPSGDLWIWASNFREELRVNLYNADGTFNQESLAKLDHNFRCKRTDEERAVDPKLYVVLSIIFDHFEGKRIELTSGFRFQKNQGSRHFHASAMDIRVEGVSMRELYDFAESLDGGGMGIGIYPRSGFIHIDFRAPGEPSYRWTDYSGPKRRRARRRGPRG